MGGGIYAAAGFTRPPPCARLPQAIIKTSGKITDILNTLNVLRLINILKYEIFF
jgi:hypothetical protein